MPDAILIHIPTTPWAHLVFDGMAWSSSALLGVVLLRWRLRQSAERLAHIAGPAYFFSLAVGAVPGAWLAGSFNSFHGLGASLSHSVVGALAGAIIGVEIYKMMRGVKASTGSIFVGPFSLGISIGRWGCLFAGLPDFTYGTPTTLPWGVDLGDGISRHPVQIYESLSMAAFLAVYLLALARHRNWAYRRSFYAMVAWYGGQRFVWEFLKPYPTLLGPFNIFHAICLGISIYGCFFFARSLQRERRTKDCAVPVLRTNDEPV
jgi:prolipoprotein diacylglyceryltransferase